MCKRKGPKPEGPPAKRGAFAPNPPAPRWKLYDRVHNEKVGDVLCCCEEDDGRFDTVMMHEGRKKDYPVRKADVPRMRRAWLSVTRGLRGQWATVLFKEGAGERFFDGKVWEVANAMLPDEHGVRERHNKAFTLRFPPTRAYPEASTAAFTLKQVTAGIELYKRGGAAAISARRRRPAPAASSPLLDLPAAVLDNVLSHLSSKDRLHLAQASTAAFRAVAHFSDSVALKVVDDDWYTRLRGWSWARARVAMRLLWTALSGAPGRNKKLLVELPDYQGDEPQTRGRARDLLPGPQAAQAFPCVAELTLSGSACLGRWVPAGVWGGLFPNMRTARVEGNIFIRVGADFLVGLAGCRQLTALYFHFLSLDLSGDLSQLSRLRGLQLQTLSIGGVQETSRLDSLLRNVGGALTRLTVWGGVAMQDVKPDVTPCLQTLRVLEVHSLKNVHASVAGATNLERIRVFRPDPDVELTELTDRPPECEVEVVYTALPWRLSSLPGMLRLQLTKLDISPDGGIDANMSRQEVEALAQRVTWVDGVVDIAYDTRDQLDASAPLLRGCQVLHLRPHLRSDFDTLTALTPTLTSLTLSLRNDWMTPWWNSVDMEALARIVAAPVLPLLRQLVIEGLFTYDDAEDESGTDRALRMMVLSGTARAQPLTVRLVAGSPSAAERAHESVSRLQAFATHVAPANGQPVVLEVFEGYD